MIVDLILGGSTVILLALSAFFSGSETALFAVPASERHLLGLRGDTRARGVSALLKDLRTVLVTVLIGNTFVNILLAVLATRVFIRHLGPERGAAVSAIAVTAILLVFGEILPKSLAVRSPLAFSLRVAGPLLRVKSLLARPTTLFQRLNRKVLGVLERLVPGDDLEIQGDEMVALMSLGEEHGSIDAREKQLVEGVFGLGDRSVQEVMTQRVDLLLLTSEQMAGEAAVELRKAGRSYAPVFEDRPDNIVGLISAPMLLRADPERPVGEICGEAEFCPESRKAGSLLRELLERELPLAVVLDEYGALAGMATLEDLYEVLVGEILDSEDRESLRYYQPAEGTLVASSRLPLDKATELLGHDFPSDAVETLGGYLMERLGEVPRRGEHYDLDGLRWTVLSAEGPSLGTLRLERLS